MGFGSNIGFLKKYVFDIIYKGGAVDLKLNIKTNGGDYIDFKIITNN